MKNKFKSLHFEILDSTNQKLYQLTEIEPRSWTVVSTDNQTSGKGYASNVWESEPYKNATFSFSINQSLIIDKEMPFFNMWVVNQIITFLTNWQLGAKVKWPNDIILNSKKIGGILIESKLSGDKTKFSIVGIGLNLFQENFENLEQASSIRNEKPDFETDVGEFIHNLMEHFYDHYDQIEKKEFELILATYNQHLFRKNKISVFKLNGENINGIIRYVNAQGNIVIALENREERAFLHKQIQLLY